jgi:hypothetical protein
VHAAELAREAEIHPNLQNGTRRSQEQIKSRTIHTQRTAMCQMESHQYMLRPLGNCRSEARAIPAIAERQTIQVNQVMGRPIVSINPGARSCRLAATDKSLGKKPPTPHRKKPRSRAEPWTTPGRLWRESFPAISLASVIREKFRRSGDAEDVTKAHMDARRPRLSRYFGGNTIGKDATLCKVPNPVADLPQAICEYRRSSPSFISGLSLGRQDTLAKLARHLGEVRWQWLES